MPYKNPERKRQWERENRAKRSAQRKERTATPALIKTRSAAPDPTVRPEEPTSFWKVLAGIAGFVAVIGLSVLGASAGAPSRSR